MSIKDQIVTFAIAYKIELSDAMTAELPAILEKHQGHSYITSVTSKEEVRFVSGPRSMLEAVKLAMADRVPSVLIVSWEGAKGTMLQQGPISMHARFGPHIQSVLSEMSGDQSDDDITS